MDSAVDWVHKAILDGRCLWFTVIVMEFMRMDMMRGGTDPASEIPSMFNWITAMNPEDRIADPRLIRNLVEYWLDASKAPDGMQVAQDCTEKSKSEVKCWLLAEKRDNATDDKLKRKFEKAFDREEEKFRHKEQKFSLLLRPRLDNPMPLAQLGWNGFSSRAIQTNADVQQTITTIALLEQTQGNEQNLIGRCVNLVADYIKSLEISDVKLALETVTAENAQYVQALKEALALSKKFEKKLEECNAAEATAIQNSAQAKETLAHLKQLENDADLDFDAVDGDVMAMAGAVAVAEARSADVNNASKKADEANANAAEANQKKVAAQKEKDENEAKMEKLRQRMATLRSRPNRSPPANSSVASSSGSR